MWAARLLRRRSRKLTKREARLEHGVDSLAMVALKPMRKGEEVLNDYGPLPRSDLLRRYG